MKVVGSLMNRRAFQKLWRLAGQPTLVVIPPISTWTLPSGVTFDPHRGQFLQNGRQATVDWKTQTLLTLPFLPQPQQNEVALLMPGVATTPKTGVTLLWSKANEAAIKVAWGVGVNNRLYRVSHWELDPLGVETPNSIRVDLLPAAL